MKLANERLEGYGPLFREYHIVKQIGSGGSSIVYLAKSATGHQVAIKVISIPSTAEWEAIGGDNASLEKAAALFNGSRPLLQKTRKEYEYAQKLERSDYTVKVLAFEEKHFPLLPNAPIMGTDILICMEWQDCDLDQLAKKKGQPFSEQEILQVGHDVVSALMDLHTAKMKHCDVKPKNIFVNDYHKRRYKLGDFGSSHISTGNTMEAQPSVGTRGFMAPEGRSGCPEFSSDLFSLGIVLYWMASGEVPNPDSDVSKWKRPDGLSDGLWSVIQTACAYLPAYRFLSALDMRNSLDELSRNRHTTGISAKADCEKKVEQNMNSKRTNTPKPANRKKTTLKFAALAASVLFLAASAIGIFGHILNKPVSEAEFINNYYAQNDEFDNMKSDYNFDVKTDGAMKGAYPRMSGPGVSEIPFGDDISVTLSFTGTVGHVGLADGAIILNGFCATKSFKQISDNEIKLVFTNVQAAETGLNSPKSITIAAGMATNGMGDMTASITSNSFFIHETFGAILLETLYGLSIYLMVAGLALLALFIYTCKEPKMQNRR